MTDYERQIADEISRAPLYAVPGFLARERREQKDAIQILLDIAVFLAKLALNVFNAAIVSWGIHANGNFASLGEPYTTIAAVVIGCCAQVGVMAVFYRLFTKTGIRNWKTFFAWVLRVLPMIVIASGLIAFEIFHSLTVQMKGSAGSQLELRLESDFERLNGEISALDELISETYETQLASHLKLADDSAQGRDDSGIAEEGSRFREQMRRYSEATSRFGSLQARIPAVNPEANVNKLFQDAQARFAALSGKKQDLETLFSEIEKTSMPRRVDVAFGQIETALGRSSALMDTLRYASTQSLAVNSTFELVEGMEHGRLEHKQDLFALAYALAPTLILLLLCLYSGISNNETDSLRLKLSEQKEQLDLLRRMGKTESEIWGATESWYSLWNLNEKWRSFFARKKNEASESEPV